MAARWRAIAVPRAALLPALVAAAACGDGEAPSRDTPAPSGAPPPAVDRQLTGIAQPSARPGASKDQGFADELGAPDMPAAMRQVFDSRRAPLLATLADERATVGERAEALGSLGMLFMAVEAWDGAESSLRRAHELAPADRRWPYLLGHVGRARSSLADALGWYETTVEIAPDDVAAHVWLGNVRAALGDAERAARAFRRGVDLDPAAASAHYGLGRLALDAGRFDDAARHLQRALEIQPGATVVHYGLALAYRGMGREDEARREMNERGDVEPFPRDPLLAEIDALIPDPQDDNARGMRALTEGRLDDAVEAFRSALDVRPDEVVYLLNLGNALALRGELDAARSSFEEALRLAPDEPRALLNLGTIHAQQGRPAQAIEHYERAVAADPDLREARLSLGAELLRAGRPADAIAPLARAVELDSQDEQSRVGYAMALALTGRHADARRACEDGLAGVGRSVPLEHVLARLLAASPDDEVRDGRRALELARRVHEAESSPDSAETLAMALAEAGRFAEAAELQRAVSDAAARSGLAPHAAALRATLALYESGRPCRTPWRAR